MINPFAPVIPPDAFALTDSGATYVRVGEGEKPAVSLLRHFDFPADAFTLGAFGTPVFASDAFAPVVAAARRAGPGALRRASVVIPDAWARTMTLDFDLLPPGRKERTDMVHWKLKKLLPGRVDDLEVSFAEIAKTGEGARLLVSASPRETIRSIEAGFAASGVRVGRLQPATLALFNGLDRRLAKAAGGDYLLLHRSRGTSSLLIARGGHPLFYRQKSTAVDAVDDAQEIRLSLSYYTEAFSGPTAPPPLYVLDEA
ncbi:MAG TPA: hypothetical protein VG777_08645, partial [Thermoanaerobaculia bacterium]|nr:hypothetical protein [Thermoanaerobaculia bacterium]